MKILAFFTARTRRRLRRAVAIENARLEELREQARVEIEAQEKRVAAAQRKLDDHIDRHDYTAHEIACRMERRAKAALLEDRLNHLAGGEGAGIPSTTAATNTMTTKDLLEQRLIAIDAAVTRGVISEDTRQIVVKQLLLEIDAVCAMQYLINTTADTAYLAVEICYGETAPELHVQIAPGTLPQWAERLEQIGYSEGLGAANWLHYTGPCAVRLTDQYIDPFARLEKQPVALAA